MEIKPHKIEKNIPVPAWQKIGVNYVTARTMKPGDSVYFSNPVQAMGLAGQIRKIGFVAVTRKEKSGRRVWMLKE